MPVILDDFPEIPKPPHQVRNQKYSWEELMSGKVFGMKEGEDFDIKLRVMRQTAAAYAKRHGYSLEMKSDLVNKILYLRATRIEEPFLSPKRGKPGPEKRSGAARESVAAKPRVAEAPKTVDPVSFVFGEADERVSERPKLPPDTAGFSFGDKPQNREKNW